MLHGSSCHSSSPSGSSAQRCKQAITHVQALYMRVTYKLVIPTLLLHHCITVRHRSNATELHTLTVPGRLNCRATASAWSSAQSLLRPLDEAMHYLSNPTERADSNGHTVHTMDTHSAARECTLPFIIVLLSFFLLIVAVLSILILVAVRGLTPWIAISVSSIAAVAGV